MKQFLLTTLAFVAVLLSSCNKSSGGGQHATVQMRDGTSVSGTILASSPSEVQIAGDDKITRTIPMTQVSAIQYDQVAPPATAANIPPATAANTPPPTEPVAPPPATVAPVPANPAPTNPPPAPAPAAPLTEAPPPPHVDHYHPVESAVTTRTHEVPTGTELQVRTEETIDSGKAVEGQTFPGELVNSVRDVNGKVVIPRGSNAEIIIVSATKGGKFRGTSDLVLDLSSVSVDGRLYRVETANIEQQGKEGVGANKRTAEYSGGAAAVGAIIGAIAGGGKGAAIGAGSGAGAGALTQILTKGTIKVPAETVLTFRLERPLHFTAAR
jgi:hypothetical protein